MDKSLKISEMFYSLQGEGPTRGKPAVFVRTAGCNIHCGGPNGSLIKEGKAAWACDSEQLWKSGVDYSFEAFSKKLFEIVPSHLSTIRIAWTGGEPVLHARTIIDFMKELRFQNPTITFVFEIETNGTILNAAAAELYNYVDQINCSPKLANSGVPQEDRLVIPLLESLDTLNTVFKFVIYSREDWREIVSSYLPYISRSKIALMPAGISIKELEYTSKIVWKIAEEEGVDLSLRDHITVWDTKQGV